MALYTKMVMKLAALDDADDGGGGAGARDMTTYTKMVAIFVQAVTLSSQT